MITVHSSRFTEATLASLFVFVIVCPSALGQQTAAPQRYFPLDQHTPPGVVAQWHSLSAGTRIGNPQAVRVEVTGGATVSFYDYSATRLQSQPSPAQAKLAVGHLYRLSISGMNDYPGVELYPSVEILDQLHPPQGMEDRYPVPVAITQKEIKAALAGRLVTKVVYLEQPRDAVGKNDVLAAAVKDVAPRTNAIAEADRLGRPMLILRLGGRTPSTTGSNHGFYGTGGPVLPSIPSVGPTARNLQSGKAGVGFARLLRQRSTSVAGL